MQHGRGKVYSEVSPRELSGAHCRVCAHRTGFEREPSAEEQDNENAHRNTGQGASRRMRLRQRGVRKRTPPTHTHTHSRQRRGREAKEGTSRAKGRGPQKATPAQGCQLPPWPPRRCLPSQRLASPRGAQQVPSAGLPLGRCSPAALSRQSSRRRPRRGATHLAPADEVGLGGQEVHHLALAFVPPLRAQHHRHPVAARLAPQPLQAAHASGGGGGVRGAVVGGGSGGGCSGRPGARHGAAGASPWTALPSQLQRAPSPRAPPRAF